MPEFTWSIPPNCSDRSLVAMEQMMISSKNGMPCCMRIPMSDGITAGPDSIDKWEDDEEISKLASCNVNPLAVTVFSGPPGSIGINPKTKNALFISEIRNHEPWNGIVQMFDEIWTTPGRPFDVMNSISPKVPRPVVPSSSPPSLIPGFQIPEGSPVVMMHEEWEDARGVESVVRAWLRSPDFKNGVLIVSMRSSFIDQSSALMTRIRMEEGCPVGRNKIFLLTSPSRRILDHCLSSSDILVCAHVEERGWRPLAIKAALSGKQIVSTNRGDITKHISNCTWVETPDLKNVTYESMEQAMSRMTEGFRSGMIESLSSDAKSPIVIKMSGNKMMEFLKEAGDRLLSPGE